MESQALDEARTFTDSAAHPDRSAMRLDAEIPASRVVTFSEASGAYARRGLAHEPRCFIQPTPETVHEKTIHPPAACVGSGAACGLCWLLQHRPGFRHRLGPVRHLP